MAKHDWIPAKHEELYEQSIQTVSYLTPEVRKRIGLGIGTPIGVWYDTIFLDQYGLFTTAFLNWRNPSTRTPVIIRVLLDERKEFVTVYRQLYTGTIRLNPLVTDTDLISMGMPPHSDKKSKKSQIADDYPWTKIITRLLRHMIIEYGSSETSRAKPKGQHGVELVYLISNERPNNISQLIHTVFDTSSPITIEFSEEERGKNFWFAVRWENTRGEKGPWSAINSAIIP
jgi:hypothetical protein